MFTRKFFGALGLVATLGLGSVAAQESAVIVLRSGERVTGSVVDLNAQGFHVSVNNAMRFISPNDVAAISFTGDLSDADYNAVQAGQAVLVLRDGQTVVGELYDIGGTAPLRITMRVAGQDRDIMSNQVARILWARPGAAAPTGAAAGIAAGVGADGAVIVAANQQWVSTGITVSRNQTVQFQSSGEVRLSAEPSDLAGVDGSANRRYAAGSPLPRVLAGGLIGRVGNGTPFAIGSQTSVQMPNAGILYLGVNDNSPADNEGHFTVVVTPQGRARR